MKAQGLLSGALQGSHYFCERAGRAGAQGPPGTGKTRTLLALLYVLTGLCEGAALSLESLAEVTLQRSHYFCERAGRAGAQGPPGTGKTRTLLALLQVLATANAMQPQRFAQVGPILACGDTNAATDNLVEGLLERGVRVVRIGLPSKVRIARPELTSFSLQGGCPRLFELSIAEPSHVRVVSR